MSGRKELKLDTFRQRTGSKFEETEKLNTLLDLVKELAGWVFNIDENEQFIQSGEGSLAQRINEVLDLTPILSSDSEYLGPVRMIPVTGVSNELEHANKLGIETALQVVENLEIDVSTYYDWSENKRKQITEWYRHQFRIAILDLLNKEVE